MNLKERLESMNEALGLPKSHRMSEAAQERAKKAMGGLQATFIRLTPQAVEPEKTGPNTAKQEADKNQSPGTE